MRDDIVIFLGPTLAIDEARRCLDAHYCPPADQGAVVYVANEFNPKLIVLIDGVFGGVPAVRHKEILWALSRGIRVFGAASMGAIRAAELHTEGMIGYGLIYRWYRATPLADDDEVAVAMSPVEMGSQATSDALINMRINFRRAARMGVIPNSLLNCLTEIARSHYFADRSYKRIIAEARTSLSASDLRSLTDFENWLTSNLVDQKREDALGLLRLVASNNDRIWKQYQPHKMVLTQTWLDDLDASGLDTRTVLDKLD